LKLAFEEIVDINAFGRENTRKLNKFLPLAASTKISSAADDRHKVLLVVIDLQVDFMDDGALPVPGAYEDVKRLTRWMYQNLSGITKIAVSLDTHVPHQIFHPCWWVDEKGINPTSYTVITLEDLDKGRWKAVFNPDESREYLIGLKEYGRLDLIIWPYHCIQGTKGAALEAQFANMLYAHEAARKSVPIHLVKGTDPLSEMYGIIKPEFDRNNFANLSFLNLFEEYDQIVVAGQAKTHCVLSSVQQFFEHYRDRQDVLKKFYILEDCMSPIPGFDVDEEFARFEADYKVKIVKSTKFGL
jgi:nicotinamidase-related amidase